MDFFSIISLFGGLALFLYGMRLMGDSLKEGSSGTLKKVMEKLTDNPLKALALGIIVTALIQSSTATIVITSGLVAAGILTLHQSLGIIIGANVGTTVTGQIIRLLDISDSATAWLRLFKPSTLAPIALIIGIVLIMFLKFRNSRTVGNIAMGFGILFTGLMNMTGAVDVLSEKGVFDSLFANLGTSPVLGYVTGAGVAFILQSSSATVGILQAFSMSGQLTFKAIYAVIVGIYLGDCVTTAIVCSIGAKSDAKRVGIVNILFNLSETVLVLAVVTLLHKIGILGDLWDMTASPGLIANTNTIFNLSCALLLFPFAGIYEKLSRKIVKDEKVPANKYQDKFDALNPVFFGTPALALRSCYDMLLTMITAARGNLEAAFAQITDWQPKRAAAIDEEEDNIDRMTDAVSNYMLALNPHLKEESHVNIIDQYYKVVTEFERLGDHATNISEMAAELHDKGLQFSDKALHDLKVLKELIDRILDRAYQAFSKRDGEAAASIEPLEEVVDDMTNVLKEGHIARLRAGECNIDAGTCFLNLLSDIERISDLCSNIGVETIARINPELEFQSHDYMSSLHSGSSERFNREYHAAHNEFFAKLSAEAEPSEE